MKVAITRAIAALAEYTYSRPRPMVFLTYVADNIDMCYAQIAIEYALRVTLEQRDSSFYACPYYRAKMDRQRCVELAVNKDFEGEPLEDDVSTNAVVLMVTAESEGDDMIARLDAVPFFRRLRISVR